MDSAKPQIPFFHWNWIPILGLLGLFAGQAWLTLGLFGCAGSWRCLLDERPILSGCHPLHQYHGYLGAQAMLHRGCCCCYDPAFQAGYPKTPIFDSGSRFAELFMLLTGGEYNPAAYKIGLALLFCCLPLFVLVAARGAGLNWWESWLAVFLALLTIWGTPARTLVEVGEMDLLVASGLLLAELGLLVRFDREPGFFGWLGTFLLGALGWFAHPLLFALLIPLVLCYYLSAGVRHKSLWWHAGLWSSQAGALGINSLWLSAWVHHWWIRSALPPSVEVLPHRTFRTLWESPLWGQPADRALAWFLIGTGLLGILLINLQRKQRATARLFGLSALTLLGLALLGISWQQVGQVGTSELLVPALWFLSIPAAHAILEVSRWLGSLPVQPVLRWGVVGAVALLLVLFSKDHVPVLLEQMTETAPLAVGLSQDRQDLINHLRESTTNEARILWEDQAGGRESSRWTALLPLLTGRAFLGGLDPEGRIEHSHCGFVRSMLSRKPPAEWSDVALQDYCQRYNIGWAVIWSPLALERFHSWKSAEKICEVHDGKRGCLFRIHLDKSGFALHGQAELVEADGQRLILANVVPKDGKVVLKFHYQSGLEAIPNRVQIDPDPDLRDDNIPFLRLKVDSPVARLVLTWKKRLIR